MTNIFELEVKIKEIINQLKGLCSQNGLGNQADEERIITTVFLYKFINDKFMSNLNSFARDLGTSVDEVLKNENDELDAFYTMYSKDVALNYNETIEYLINKISDDNFYKIFDVALVSISNNKLNEFFCIESADGTRKPLFEPISDVVDASARNNFSKAILSIISEEKFDFSSAFDRNFDFYSAIFEHLIKDYNTASGVYAEYFTPQTVSTIIAKILVGSSEKVQASEIYDPSAGSGSLVLHLAHELGEDNDVNRAIIYTQDISNKSTRFLRINLLLNRLSESLGNVIQGDTLLNPAHYMVENNPLSGLKKYDYITSNPPYRVDFSTTRNEIEDKWANTERFFAGIPKTPKTKKESMPIYTLFIQHILYSLKETGKAAIVLPSGFLTAATEIEYKIRKKLIDEKILKGVVSMPSNIFANTGTKVSVIFIDKSQKTEDVILIDASKLGSKAKDGKNQKTILTVEDIDKIVNTFINKDTIDDFSVKVTFNEIIKNEYNINAGRYFDVKFEDLLTTEELNIKLQGLMSRLKTKFAESNKLQEEVMKQLGGISYE